MRPHPLLPTLALALVPAAAPAQAGPAAVPAPRAFAHGASIVMGFDDASGWGTVDLQPMPLESAQDARLQALFKFKGRALAAPPERVSLALHLRGPAPAHAATRTVRLTPDAGAPVVLPVLFRQVDSSGAQVREVLALSAPRAAVLRLTAARRVGGTAGPAAFALGEPHLEALRDFASRMTPAAHRAALGAAAGPGGPPPGGRARRPGTHAATEVEQRARQKGGLVPPKYPVVPLAERRSRTVSVEFVVDTSGLVDPASVLPVLPADTAFAHAVRAVVGQWAFEPARLKGKAVAQVVVQSIPFDAGAPLPEPLEMPAPACAPAEVARFGGRVYVEGHGRMVIPAEGNAPPTRPKGVRGEGGVNAQFVVDSTGAVVPCTVAILDASHPALGAAVREAVLGWRFEPARLHGIAVPQLVERSFRFVP